MEAVAAAAPPPDDALAARSRTGDRDALRTLYEPHFEGVFDFALRIVRDRGVAGFVLQDTFAKALRAAQTPDHVKAWLYGIARGTALDGLRHRRRPLRWTDEAREGLDFTNVDAKRLSDPSEVVFDNELIELVWNTAVVLDVEDYSLLDLHIRRQLGAREVAQYLGTNADALAPRLVRLHDSFEDSVLAVLLATRVRRSCASLDNALSGVGDDLVSPAARRAVEGHLRECGACRESKRSLASPSEVLGSFAPMPAPSGLQEDVARQLSAVESGAVSSNRRGGFLFRHSVVAPGG